MVASTVEQADRTNANAIAIIRIVISYPVIPRVVSYPTNGGAYHLIRRTSSLSVFIHIKKGTPKSPLKSGMVTRLDAKPILLVLSINYAETIRLSTRMIR
jgi:hypothetical protein